MPLNVADRVRDTTTTTGTGTITLSGTPPTGYQSFNAVGNGNTTYYTINAGSQWEVGIGTYSGAGPTLSRDTVLASSSGGSLVDFAAGTKDVFCDYPASKSISDGFGTLPIANGGTGATDAATARANLGAGTGNGTVTSVAGTGTVNGITLTGTVTTSGSLTLGGTLSGVNLTSQVTGTLNVANGGTGATTLTSGYLVKGNGTSAVSASVVYDNGTNAGIGTSSPSSKLDVSGLITLSGAENNQLRWLNTGKDWRANVSAAGNWYLYDVTNSKFPFTIEGNAPNDAFRLASSGNVGIGTSSPGEKLQVVGSIRVNTTGTIFSNIYTSPGNTQTWFVNNGSSSDTYLTSDTAQRYRMLTDVGHRWETAVAGTAGGSISWVERMTLDLSGNVGIGNSGPGYRLDISAADTTAGLGYAMRLRSNATAAAATMQFTNSPVTAQNGLISCTDTGILTLQGGDGGTGAIAFRTGGDERFKINNTGGITSSALADAVGYKGLPQNQQTASYTLALGDMGKHISITTGGVVIPANGSVAFPIGATIVVFNNSASSQTISITTDTLRLAGTATTGSRTLAQYGLATLVKVTSTVWVASGNVT